MKNKESEKMINRNKMAKWVAEREHGKVNLSIAQIKEAGRWYLIYLATECRPSEVLDLLDKVSDEWDKI